MAASPKYKVYSNDGEYVGCCKCAEDAAILVSIGYSDRGTIRLGHGKVLFTAEEGCDMSYDAIAAVVHATELQYQRAEYRKVYGSFPGPEAR